MNKASKIIAAKKHFKIAKQVEEELNTMKTPNDVIGLRMVAGQNYFYAFIHAIDAKLAEIGIFPKNHEDRGNLITRNYRIFKDNKIETRYTILMNDELSYRRKVTYRGENGNKFQALKEAAEIAIKEIENEA